MAKAASKKGKRLTRKESMAIFEREERVGFEAFGPKPAPRKKAAPPLEAKTETQGHFIAQIASKDLVFTKGPAGTGKTYVAVSMAIEALMEKKVEKLVFTRPMVGCDEEEWILPGEEDEKFAPWAGPMMDVIEERAGAGFAKYLIKSKVIEFKPMMSMRGSSFRDAWVMMDEAQNSTPEQMKMFLTRLGEGSKMVISGDVRQSDLKDGRGVMQENGLDDALARLRGEPEIGFVRFSIDDCVRHGLVKKILKRYETDS